MNSRNSLLIILLMFTLLGAMLYGQDHLSKAGKYFFMKDYRNAIKEYKQALKIDPHDGRIHYNIGACYEKLGELREAVKAYQLALKHDPNLEEVKTALDRINESDEIQADLKASAALRKANAAFMQKDYQTAISEYKKAINASPGNFQALYNIASCYEHIGNFEQAIQHYETALEVNPESEAAQTSYDRIKDKYSSQLLATYKTQLDSLVDGKYLSRAQRKARQILRLAPGDRWTLKKLRIVRSEIESRVETPVQAGTSEETLTETVADTIDSTAASPSVAAAQPPTESKQKESESDGFPMYMLYILVGGMLVIIVLIVMMMLKRSGGDKSSGESEPVTKNETSESEPASKPEETPTPVENLANKSVYDIVQDHYTTKKTGILRVKGKGTDGHIIEGEVRMLNGNIVDSNSNEKSGVDALYQLLEINDITEITFQNMKVTDSGNIRQATLPLLMKWTLGMKKE